MVMKVILLVKDTEVIANKEKTDDDVEMVEKMALGKRKMLKLVNKPTSSS